MMDNSKKSRSSWVRAATTSPRTWVWLTAALAACGLKLNINGQTHTVGGGGGGDATTASAGSPQTAGNTRTTSSAKKRGGGGDDDAPIAPASYKAAAFTIKDALTSTPQIADIDGVALDGRFSKILHGDSPECGQYVSSHPIASIDIQTPSAGMEIEVSGARNDGFVLAVGSQFYSVCPQSMNQGPTMAAPKGGWQPGHYDIYPVARFAKPDEGFHFQVAISDPTKLAPWSGDVRAIKIEGKLATPMLVEVPLHANRRVTHGGLGGSQCDKVALAFEPDVSVHVMRPIAGLVIRPLPSRAPLTMRVEQRKDDKRTNFFCLRNDNNGSTKGPTWHTGSELGLNNEEGVWGVSLGTAPDAKVAADEKITLMIYDESTKLDGLALRQLPGEGPLDLEHRALPWHFPQLDIHELDLQTRDHAELAAKLFASAPAGLFVYPDLDLDKEIASVEGNNGTDAGYPKKNEPLLVLEVERGEQALVMGQDGMKFRVKDSHLAMAADGAPALLAAPRPLRAGVDLYALESLNQDKKAQADYESFEKKYGDCVDRVAEPYERQVPRVVASDGTSIELQDSRTRSIRDAEDNAIIHACGSREAHDKAKEKIVAKMLVAAEKMRSALFVTAKPKL